MFLVAISLSGVKRVHEELHFPLTCEDASLSGYVTKTNAMNYLLWETTVFF